VTSPRVWLTRIIAVMALVSLLAACAPPTGSPPPSSSPVASSGGSPVAQNTNPVKIGASISLTGKDARIGKELQQGYLLWQEQVNAKGGILGRQVDMTILDDTSDPETASKLYEKLISEDKVDLVIGPYSSPVTLPASTVTEKYGYPMIVSGASATDIFTRGYKNVFGMYTAAPFYMDGAIDIAAKNGYKTIGIMNENSAFAKDVMAGAKKKAAEQNLTIVFEEEYGRDVRDLSPILTKMRQANPDMLLGGTYGEDATILVRQLKDMNWAPKVVALTVGPALPDFFQNLGPDANFIYGPTQWEPSIKGAGVPEFVASYKTKYGYEPGYHAGGGFAAGQVLQQAVEQAKTFDRDKLRDTLRTLQATTIYGNYKVGENGNQEAKASYLVQWQNGERKLVWPDAVAESKYIIPTPDWGTR
jgi:branched-chain amino acid transport system substrate-binding protein